MATEKNKPPLTDFGLPLLPGEQLRGAEAVEKNTESIWALFTNLKEAQDAPPGQAMPQAKPAAQSQPVTRPVPGVEGDPRYADTLPTTEPGGLPRPPKPPVTFSTSPATLAEAMVEARRNNRVCPRLEHWQRLYAILPVKKPKDPPPPPAGAAWNETPSLSKRSILRAQIEWAAANSTLHSVVLFMQGLPEDQWVHMGD